MGRGGTDIEHRRHRDICDITRTVTWPWRDCECWEILQLGGLCVVQGGRLWGSLGHFVGRKGLQAFLLEVDRSTGFNVSFRFIQTYANIVCVWVCVCVSLALSLGSWLADLSRYTAREYASRTVSDSAQWSCSVCVCANRCQMKYSKATPKT